METAAPLEEVTALRAVDRLFLLALHHPSPNYPAGTTQHNTTQHNTTQHNTTHTRNAAGSRPRATRNTKKR
jgi:hypothetical protein